MGKHRQVEENYGVGFQFFKKLFLITSVLNSESRYPLLLVAATIGFSIGNEFAGYYVGLIPGKMYGALLDANKGRFWHLVYIGTLMYIGKCTIAAVLSFFSWLLYLSWRRNAVRELHRLYFSNRVYYQMNCIDDEGIDNPDQRITQDTERMCNQLAITIVPNVLIGPFVIAWYTWKTWASAGIRGVAIIYGYFVVGTIVNKFLISPMAKWSARVEKTEGNFRYKHASIRANAESSAFYDAQNFELYECNRLFRNLLGRQFMFICWKLPTYFWQQTFDYYGVMVSYLIQFIPVFIMHSYDGMPPADMGTVISNVGLLIPLLFIIYCCLTHPLFTACLYLSFLA